ncbi:MAG: ester cyclase [Ktedonobacteraceae bacterium]|nr:ester cyclase [Ktedonobacteraceae bacterium]
MSPVKLVQTFVTALQSGDMTLASNLTTDDFMLIGLLPHRLGKSEALAVQSALLAAFPDFSYDLDDVRQENGNVGALVSVAGTHTGTLSLPGGEVPEVRASGLAIRLPQMRVVYRIAGDRVAAMLLESPPGGALNGLLQQVATELRVARRERIVSDPAYEEGSGRLPDVEG